MHFAIYLITDKCIGFKFIQNIMIIFVTIYAIYFYYTLTIYQMYQIYIIIIFLQFWQYIKWNVFCMDLKTAISRIQTMQFDSKIEYINDNNMYRIDCTY